MKPIIINQMRGLNTSRARLQLQPGEVGCLQNVRQRPFDNWAKRRGVATSATQSDPVYGIFEWDMDEIVMPCYQAGGTLTFFPVLPVTVESQGGNASTTVTPDPHPVSDPLDPHGTQTAAGISFGLEQAMRALQERICRRGGGTVSWPAGQYDAEGNAATVACATVPISTFYGTASTAIKFPQIGLYRYDCYWGDINGYTAVSPPVPAGSPAGTTAAALVQLLVDSVDAECTNWLKGDPEDQTDLSAYSWASASLWGGAKPTATAANYRTVLGAARDAIGKLNYYSVGASQTNVMYREGSVMFGGPTCSDAKTTANALWASSSWATNPSYTSIKVFETTKDEPGIVPSDPHTFDATVFRTRGKITADLSNYKSANGACFLMASPLAGGLSNASDCPVSVDSKWHAWQGVNVGQVVTSDYINDNSTAPTFTSSCPLGGSTLGWSLSPAVILNFRYTYPA